jgi:hypothetical protein
VKPARNLSIPMSRNQSFTSRLLISAVVLASAGTLFSQSDSNRGLWVGEVSLTHVNEVSVPLDENNIPVAPNPRVATSTADSANLRIILHVNGAGQVSLLRDVALVRRKTGTFESESDISLLTDESLYGEVPPQAAERYASATYDFGDPQATAALNKVVETAIEKAYDAIKNNTQATLDTTAKRNLVTATAFDAANAASAAPAVIPTADAAAAFNQFLTTKLNLAKVDELAASADPNVFAGSASTPATLREEAKKVADDSFYNDRRASEMVEALVTALQAAAGETQANKTAVARATAAAYADTLNNYQRFIAGEIFGDMLTSTAASVALEAKPQVPAAIGTISGTVGSTTTRIFAIAHGLQTGNEVTIAGSSIPTLNGTHPVSVLSLDDFVVNIPYIVPVAGNPLGKWFRSDLMTTAAAQNPAGLAAEAEALRIQITAYSDQRAITAVRIVRQAIVDAALNAVFKAALLTPESREALVKADGLAAGRKALAEDVARYPLPDGAPSTDYTDFVRSSAYTGSAEKAARAVADAMVEEKATNILATEGSVKGKARAAAMRALDAEYSAAARSAQTFIRVETGAVGGGFGAGKGDPRLTADVGGDDQALGGPAMMATLVLPASHPTNPFRHRRHPDHTFGFDITRKLRFDFDVADPSPNPKAGYGVDRLSGIYREEIFGLHKPLGPDPENNPIGIRMEGRFEIYRVSLIDALNAR